MAAARAGSCLPEPRRRGSPLCRRTRIGRALAKPRCRCDRPAAARLRPRKQLDPGDAASGGLVPLTRLSFSVAVWGGESVNVAALPKADLHLHAETDGRVDRILARRE